MFNKLASAAALALAVGLSSSPAFADAAFDAIQRDLLGSAPLPSDTVTASDGIQSGEVGDFLNEIPQLQASALERRCSSAVQLQRQHMAATVDFCREYLATIDESEQSDEIEARLNGQS
ncbi:MAG: hypothetical protein IT535_00935 [Bauldia sp.]|nr:hypothetical protein [Bauldia sp.]